MLSICNQWICTCVRVYVRLWRRPSTNIQDLLQIDIIVCAQDMVQAAAATKTMYQLRNQHAQHVACNVKHELNTDMQMHCVRSGATLLGKVLVAQTATCKTPIVYRHSNSAKRAANPGMEVLMTLAVRTSFKHSHASHVPNGLMQIAIAEV